MDKSCQCPLLPSSRHWCAGSSGSAVGSRSCGSRQVPLCWGLMVAGSRHQCWDPAVPGVTAPQPLCQAEAKVASACSSLPFPAALLCPQRGSPASREPFGLCSVLQGGCCVLGKG